MKIKRFVAKNMREAIRQVREEQGPDAVILSNRRVNGGVEVVAAVDYDAALMQQSVRRSNAEAAAAAEKAADKPAEKAAAPAPTPAPVPAPRPAEKLAEKPAAQAARVQQSFVPPPPPAIAPRTEKAIADLLAEFGEPEAPKEMPKPAVRVQPAASLAAASQAADSLADELFTGPAKPIRRPPGITAMAAPSSEYLELQREIGGMRQMIEQQLTGLSWNEMKQSSPLRYSILRVLSDVGLAPELARELADAMPPRGEVDRARFLPLGLLARKIPIARHDAVLDGGVIALVGPTGVGKTTTIAKLAARYAERNGARDIALVAMDSYRIGAQEQLYTYGRLLGVPVYTVTPQQSLEATLAKLGNYKLVLIDTTGMSQRDAALTQQIETLSASEQLRCYLVLAANSQASDQDDVVRRFSQARLSGCILTKLDETSRIGGALSAAIRHQLPLAYVTDGQRVPEDMEVASADKLVIRAMQLARQSPTPLDDELLAMQFGPMTRNSEGAAHAHS